MKRIAIEVVITDPTLAEFGLPRPATKGDAGVDLRAMCVFGKTVDGKPDISVSTPIGVDGIQIPPGVTEFIGTGFAMHMMDTGFAAHIIPRSSSSSIGLMLGNTQGLIDPTYCGPLIIAVLNRNPHPSVPSDAVKVKSPGNLRIERGDRIAQMYITPVLQPEWIEVLTFNSRSERGSGGYGSTGRQK